METGQTQFKNYVFSAGSITLLFLLCVWLTGCARPQAASSLSQTASPPAPTYTHTQVASTQVESTQVPSLPSYTPTSLPLPTYTPAPVQTSALTGPELDATKITLLDAEHHQLETMVAGGTPSRRTPIPVHTARPNDTPVLGSNALCVEASHTFIYGGCWNGKINGDYILVGTGAPKNDQLQGAVQVVTESVAMHRASAEQQYLAPNRAGALTVGYVAWPRMTLLTLQEYSADRNAPLTRFVFNLLTRTWEDPGPCQLFPVGLNTDVIQGMQARLDTRDIAYGIGSGSFGWLNWTGTNNEVSQTLALSLTPPGDSSTYVNPDNPSDHRVSIGDWVVGRPQATGNAGVGAALADLINGYARVAVPLWDQATGEGENLRYHVSGFAWVYVERYSLAPPDSLTIRYWGPATCPDSP